MLQPVSHSFRFDEDRDPTLFPSSRATKFIPNLPYLPLYPEISSIVALGRKKVLLYFQHIYRAISLLHYGTSLFSVPQHIPELVDAFGVPPKFNLLPADAAGGAAVWVVVLPKLNPV